MQFTNIQKKYQSSEIDLHKPFHSLTKYSLSLSCTSSAAQVATFANRPFLVTTFSTLFSMNLNENQLHPYHGDNYK